MDFPAHPVCGLDCVSTKLSVPWNSLIHYNSTLTHGTFPYLKSKSFAVIWCRDSVPLMSPSSSSTTEMMWRRGNTQTHNIEQENCTKFGKLLHFQYQQSEQSHVSNWQSQKGRNVKACGRWFSLGQSALPSVPSHGAPESGTLAAPGLGASKLRLRLRPWQRCKSENWWFDPSPLSLP